MRPDRVSSMIVSSIWPVVWKMPRRGAQVSGACFAGLVAQSAIFTQAWQTGNLLAATDAWSHALSAAAGQELKVAQ